MALDQEVEEVEGGLRRLVERLRLQLAVEGGAVSNALLEGRSDLFALVDGVDSLILDLATEELGEEELRRHARELADSTFSSARSDELSRATLREVFLARVDRILTIRDEGRLQWLRDSGARPRLVGSVEEGLLPEYDGWSSLADPLDPAFTKLLVDWASRDKEFRASLEQVYPEDQASDFEQMLDSFHRFLRAWLRGDPYSQMAEEAGLGIDDALHLHAFSLSYVFHTLVEQALALVARFLEQSQTGPVADTVVRFQEHLRFGVPDRLSLELMQGGVRHRRAALELSRHFSSEEDLPLSVSPGFLFRRQARDLLQAEEEEWSPRLGRLVYKNTMDDLN